MPHGLERLDSEPVATLATVGAGGLPHLVPITFAVVADTIVWAVDHKPKSTTRLARIRNLDRDPRVAVLVSHYEEDWTGLWWVRAEGTCQMIDDPSATAAALRALQAKYPAYRTRPPDGPFFVVTVDRMVEWAAS